ncbi:hypothetical protein Misp01_09370 [Microtetraspora sp. NBRC 13810]|uniref:ParB/RepB/Spo0J family partition protein n=1 Tax=Microtetraspora sp. NBRC 13810 TaxID=3030990 RepID=UPI0024A2701D|nr:ParB N-terminal domain-containing protein [Microtetraspora sp. NBRC 13810]GLW05807.1 hypothetical protein Misp01_09370 [Microtetraspora sp. NBRC 13810]
MPIKTLSLGYSPRRGVNEEHIQLLTQAEIPLPPILVHRVTMRVIDGVHRLLAAAFMGRDEIDVVFFDGSAEDAFLLAVRENVTHGLPLPLAERKAAAMRIISSHPHLSNRAIAGHTGLAAKTVGALRQRSSEEIPRSNARIGTDGRVRPLKSSEGRRRAAEAIERHPDASVREIARMAGVSVGTAHDVRLRLSRGEDPVPARLRTRGRPRNTAQHPPDAAPGRPPGRPVEQAQLIELPPVLQKLAKDPALRHTDPGRELLRLLHARSITVTNWSALIEAVPPHCAPVIAQIARQYAENWGRLARGLERLNDPSF